MGNGPPAVRGVAVDPDVAKHEAAAIAVDNVEVTSRDGDVSVNFALDFGEVAARRPSRFMMPTMNSDLS
jgi:hypothetical protein